MLIYFRKANEDEVGDRIRWIQKALSFSDKNDAYAAYLDQKLTSSTIMEDAKLYYIEKGDDVYGVYSYSIGKFVVIKTDDTNGEIVVLPSSDPEWDDGAKKEFFRVVSKGSLDDLGYKELSIAIHKDNQEDENTLNELGFYKAEELAGKRIFKIKKRHRILVTGVNSDLGYEVAKELLRRKVEVVGCDVDDKIDAVLSGNESIPYMSLDLADETSVGKMFKEYNPSAVINCYSWSRVDDAEIPKYQRDAYRANVEVVKNLAKACRAANAKMMQMTSDYVFNGSGKDAWDADCKAYAALNYYGKTKAESEAIVESILNRFFIVRTEWAFCEKSRNFVDLMLEFAKKRNEITVVNDQIGTPTYYKDLAVLLADMIDTEKYGYYNATNTGSCVSRNEYAKEIFKIAADLGHDEYSDGKIKVESVTSDEYRLSRAIRPLNSRLDISKLEKNGFKPLPDWKDALRRYLRNKEF